MRKGTQIIVVFLLCLVLPAPCGAGGEHFIRTEPVAGRPVVTDGVTGLVWQGCPAGLSGGDCTAGGVATYTWQNAIDYCDGLDWGGHTDWYLPDAKELRTIVDNHRTSPAIDTAIFPGTPSNWFWTSASCAGDSSDAWRVDFSGGGVDDGDKGNGNNVRCVRRGP